MAQQDEHSSSFISTVDERLQNVMPAVTKIHRDAIALSVLAHRSIYALDNEFQILSHLILQQTSMSLIEHIKPSDESFQHSFYRLTFYVIN